MAVPTVEDHDRPVRLLIWGAGELGSRVGARWAGEAVGFTRTTTRHAQLSQLGVAAQVGDPIGMLTSGHEATALLLSLPGHEQQDAAVAQLAGVTPPARTVLISTTGYYGAQGGLLDEETPPGRDARSTRIAAVEEAFLAWAGARGAVLRLGGLYGPGRGPYAALRRRGTTRKPIVPDKTLPLIHYADAAAAAYAALTRREVADCYLTVTPPCPIRAEFYAAACARLSIPLPPEATPQGGEPAVYDVRRLRRDLLPQPAYPDWRAIWQT